jgi:hypothetical protein
MEAVRILFQRSEGQFLKGVKVKVKISLLQALEAHRVARGQGSHIT